MFRLTKAEMAYEVGIIGRVMHGTKSAVQDNKNKEYGIVINLRNKDNEHTKRWTA